MKKPSEIVESTAPAHRLLSPSPNAVEASLWAAVQQHAHPAHTELEPLRRFGELLHESPQSTLATSVLLFNNLGTLLSARGMHHEALHAYSRALEHDRSHPTTLFNLIRTYEVSAHSQALPSMIAIQPCLRLAAAPWPGTRSPAPLARIETSPTVGARARRNAVRCDRRAT